jgi:hypothetical protein
MAGAGNGADPAWVGGEAEPSRAGRRRRSRFGARRSTVYAFSGFRKTRRATLPVICSMLSGVVWQIKRAGGVAGR